MPQVSMFLLQIRTFCFKQEENNLLCKMFSFHPINNSACIHIFYLTQLCLFFMGAVTNYHKLSDLKYYKYTLSQFWRPELQSQGASRAMFSLQVVREDSYLSSCFWQLLALAAGHLTPTSASFFTSLSLLSNL